MSLELRLALQEQRRADLEPRRRRLLGPFTGTRWGRMLASVTKGMRGIGFPPLFGDSVA